MTIPYPVWPVGLAAAATYVTAAYVGRALNRAGMALPRPAGRYDCIDGLRGYLAVSVMIFHFVIWMGLTRSGPSWVPSSINPYNSLGAGSVGLFFMVTGFLFYPRILSGLRGTNWAGVYIGRVFRIIPMTLLSVVLVTVIIIGRTHVLPDKTYIPAAAEWLTGWKEPPLLGYGGAARTNCYVLWTLWYEWLFYLVVLPACALAADILRHWLPSWLLPVFLLAGALTARHFHGFGGWPTMLPMFAIGMLAFEWRQNDRVRAWLAGRAMAPPALACLALGMVRQGNPYGEWQLPLFGVFFLAVACGNDFGGVLRAPGARLLGECSFGIYLLHSLALSLIFVEGGSVMARLSLNALPVLLPPIALAVICVCALLHVTVEEPAIRLGRSIARRLLARHAPMNRRPQFRVAE